MGSKYIVVVRTATSSVTSGVTVEEFETYEEAQEHFDGLRFSGESKILHAYLAVVHTERS